MATIKPPSVEKVPGFPALVLNNTLVSKKIKYPEYEVIEDTGGYTFAFSLMYLSYDSNWLDSLKREYQQFHVDYKPYFIIRTSMTIDGVNDGCYGAGSSLEIASDTSCYRLIQKIKKFKGIFIMPKNLIGYPNLRGQCYLISALVPLMFCPPFISCLFNSMFDFKRFCHLGLHQENIKLRRDPEDPYYWTSTLFKLYKDFHKVSEKGFLQLLNVDYFLKFRLKDKEYEEISDVPSHYQLPTDDLKLDRSLIKGLCSVLSTYCSRRYAIPGGDERSAYCHIVRKISSENGTFVPKFFMEMKYRFTCSECTGGPYSGESQFPLIECPPTIDFESLLRNPQTLAQEQSLRYAHSKNGLKCLGLTRQIFSASIQNLPEVLCFGIKNEESERYKSIPEFITCIHEGKESKFFHLASSVVITCYKSKAGKDYGVFYHPYVEGDIDMGAHTFLHFRTTYDYVELNNGIVYRVDDRIFRKPTPCSLHMYLPMKYMKYVPKINPDVIRKNPMY